MRFTEDKGMLKVALVGVGNISGAHIPAWEKLEDCELVALCDIRPEQMEKYSEKRCYTDFDEMLEKEEIDILDICLPTYLHADFSIKAMEKGIDVLCEKPVSLDFDDVKRVYGTAQKCGRKFMVAQVLRFMYPYDFIKTVYDNKTYGDLLSGHMRRLSQMPGWSFDDWMRDEKRSGFVPFDLHIHDLDFLVYAFGKPADVRVKRVKRPDQDYINAMYDFGGFFISAEAAWYCAEHPFTADFVFQFENAIIALAGGELTVYEKDGKIFKPAEENLTDTEENATRPKTSGYANEIEYFKNCVIADKAPDKVKPEELETVIEILRSI